MLRVIKNNWFNYVIDLVVAYVIIKTDFTLFCIYFFFVVVLKIDMSIDYLRKLIRVFQVANEFKLLAVTKKLKIGKKELDQVEKDIKSKWSGAQINDFRRDFEDVCR